jgi:type IV pilus assembly protein PilC
MDFFYEAVDTSGQVVLGKLEGDNELEVQRKLQQMGYRPQSIAPSRSPVATAMPVAMETTTSIPQFTGIGATLAAPAVRQSTMALPATARQTVAPQPLARKSVTLAGNAARTAGVQSQSRSDGRFAAPTAPARSDVSNLGGVGTRDMMLFFRQLASLVHSGHNLYGALENLAGRTPNKNLAQTAREMAEQARTGGSIAEVMDHYPRIFPDHLVNTLRAGETGGFVEIALSEIAQNYEQNIALYRTAWIPKVMATQAFFLIFIAQPLFTSLFASMDFAANMALYFKLVLFRNLPLAFLLYFAIRIGAKRIQLPQYKRWRDEMALKMPPFGDLQRQNAIATFLRMLRRLYHAGVAPINAWEGAMNTAGNLVIRERLASSYHMMQQGSSLSDAFAATGLFSNQVEQMIFTGQESGQVVEMLDQATDYYQEQVEDAHRKSRFMMLRLGIIAMLVLGGGTMLWLAHTYFQGMFDFVDKNFGTD